MQSFRTELELINHSTKALVEKDIIELDQKIRAFKEGKIADDKFKSLRLARGVYGQRQPGVQMVRIKFPFGKITTNQLERVAEVSDIYSNGNLHLTTRQDIQIHHVSLEHTPELWAKLELDEITLREACGNTVRNITASAEAGIDPNEIFDVSPYAEEVFKYFLRKPFGQELGRKIKIAFSNNDKDTAVTYIHDLGFIPKLNSSNERGFRVLIGGGLGAQPFLAKVAFEFLPVNKLIPFIESVLRVFDRYGERNNRNKARLKYLINQIGIDQFQNLILEEENALLSAQYEIRTNDEGVNYPNEEYHLPFNNDEQFNVWLRTNVIKQKQEGLFAAYVRIVLGNITSSLARLLVSVVKKYANKNDLRLTINQGILIKDIERESLFELYQELNTIGLALPGFDSIFDITSCPGTDTCNLAISNSTRLAIELEELLNDEYSELVYEKQIKIKISGCMNSCGQHGLAQIGFHGSSIKVNGKTAPAAQVLLGGGTLGNGNGRVAEKVIKVLSRRVPDVIRLLLNDFNSKAEKDESFNEYYLRNGKDYFYQLLKPLSDNSTISDEEYIDWGSDEKFKTAIGVGECAGVVIDLVQTLIFEAEEKLVWSYEALNEQKYGDSIYYSYAAMIHAAKAVLLEEGIHVNTHHQLIRDFDEKVVQKERISLNGSFEDLVLQIKVKSPSEVFAKGYAKEASEFLNRVIEHRNIKTKTNV
ncbi:MAG: HEPN domain-containing protein [Bacteroidia bacterium]